MKGVTEIYLNITEMLKAVSSAIADAPFGSLLIFLVPFKLIDPILITSPTPQPLPP